jgi:hypothetical protein
LLKLHHHSGRNRPLFIDTFIDAFVDAFVSSLEERVLRARILGQTGR